MDETAIHILIVDDDRAQRDMLCARLAELGARCDAVNSGADALTVLDWWFPVIVVIEIGMLDGSGYGLGRKIFEWASSRFRAVAIVLYSSDEESAEIRAVEYYDVFIRKPAFNQLEHAIASVLARGV